MGCHGLAISDTSRQTWLAPCPQRSSKNDDDLLGHMGNKSQSINKGSTSNRTSFDAERHHTTKAVSKIFLR